MRDDDNDVTMMLLRVLAAERGYRLVRKESHVERQQRDTRAQLRRQERQLQALAPHLSAYHLNDGWTLLDEDGDTVAEGMTYAQAHDFIIEHNIMHPSVARVRRLRLVGEER